MVTSTGLTQVQLACVLACLRRAYTQQHTEWLAPKLVGSELVTCADRVAVDGFIGLDELPILADTCYMPQGYSGPSLVTLVTCT